MVTWTDKEQLVEQQLVELGPRARPAADHNPMRELNRSLVLDAVKTKGPISRAAIAKLIPLGKPTVSAIVEGLLIEGLVREVGVGEVSAAGGRPPVLLDFDERSQFAVGVHIGVSRATIVVSDARGHEVARHVVRTARARPQTVIDHVASGIRAVLRSSGTPMEGVVAVGVVVPGPTDYDAGVCILAPELGWRDVPVRDLLSRSLDLPILVHSPGQAAAVAESVEGAGDGAGDLVLLHAGHGLSVGVLSGGKVFHGARGTAGQIAHCHVPGADQPCDCGRAGCLETLTTRPALRRAVERRIDAGRATALAHRRGPRRILPAHVAEAAAKGDEVALEAAAETGRHLGLAASWLVNVFNPDVLVVAGELAGIGEPLMGPLRRAASELTMAAAWDHVDVRQSKLTRDTEVRGTVLLALQRAGMPSRTDRTRHAWRAARVAWPARAARMRKGRG